MTTLREILERAQRRHRPGADDRYCDTCRQKCPCNDYADASAALKLMDDAGWDVLTLSGYDGIVQCRSIPDPPLPA